MVDYVLEVTNQSELFYVGHSQGTVMGFAGFSSLPDLASKIKLFVALAPVTTVHYIKGAFDFISYFYKEVEVSLPVPHSSIHSCCMVVIHNTMYYVYQEGFTGNGFHIYLLVNLGKYSTEKKSNFML